MDFAKIEHIKHRLKRRGYNVEDVSIDFLRIQQKKETSPGSGIYQLQLEAYNQYYYLNADAVPASLVIESNTHFFTTEDAANYNKFKDYAFHEFSGFLLLTSNVAIDIEFIRVIPEPVDQEV